MSKGSLPTFVIIGAQKSATRWLRVNLGRHPDVFTAPRELHFWNSATTVKKLGLDGYRRMFRDWSGEGAVGEATPGYMIWRHQPAVVAERIQEALPDVRLIAMLRNPIDRAQSAMLHHVRRGRIAPGFRLLDIVNARQPATNDWFCLVSGGWYAASLAPFLERFGDQLLVLLHDDVVADPETAYKLALEHIGSPTDFVPADLSRVVFSSRRAAGRLAYELSPEDRAALWRYFDADVARLEEMLRMDLSRWAPDHQ